MGVFSASPGVGVPSNSDPGVLLRRDSPETLPSRGNTALPIGIGIGLFVLVIVVGVAFWKWRGNQRERSWVDEATVDTKSSPGNYSTIPRRSWVPGPVYVPGPGVKVPSPAHTPERKRSSSQYAGFGVDYILQEYYRSPTLSDTPSSSADLITKVPPSPFFDTPRTPGFPSPLGKSEYERTNGELVAKPVSYSLSPHPYGSSNFPLSPTTEKLPVSPQRSASLSRHKFAQQSRLTQIPLPAPTNTTTKLPRLMKAVDDFTPTQSDELALRVDDVVRMLQEYADDWCLIERVKPASAVREEGVVPRIFLGEIQVPNHKSLVMSTMTSQSANRF